MPYNGSATLKLPPLPSRRLANAATKMGMRQSRWVNLFQQKLVWDSELGLKMRTIGSCFKIIFCSKIDRFMGLCFILDPCFWWRWILNPNFWNLRAFRPTLYLKWEAVEKTSQGPWPILEKLAFQLDSLWMQCKVRRGHKVDYSIF
jgi:hypothetical protein